MHFVTSRMSWKTARLLLALTALPASAMSGSASQRATFCNATALTGQVYERTGVDSYKSPNIEGGERLTVFTFPRRLDPLRGRTIVDQDPSYAVALLSDGSKLSFNRDCRGIRCVYLGLKTASKEADCGEWLHRARDRTASGMFALGRDRFIAVENSRSGGRLVLHTADGSPLGSVEPLIVGARPIVGFGVSVPAIHGPFRNIDLIRREKGGSLSLSSYVFKYR